MPEPSYVTCTVADHIAHVRLDRADKLNALTLDTLRQLARTAHDLRRDRQLRAVVLSGEGEAFSAGLDFGAVVRDPLGIVTSFLPRPWRGTNTFQEACWAWRRLPVPVVAAVHGHCLGGGLQLALAADFRIASPDSQWSVLEAKWGLIPDMTGIRTLAELVGIDTAKRLTMTGQLLTGTQAEAKGLVTELATDPLAASFDLAHELARRSPDALAAAKRLFNGHWRSGVRRVLAAERVEQAALLAAANTKAARSAAFGHNEPVFGPRTRV
ncbi:enoyl-CoA hydratase/isomerase family protein [Marmoricola endophyticus]|uniref:Enoyl-CoA hydratase/isomerase family protein n=1 Tax=Marmoricola endophyticus TaxID=2040280 RepID=A0A917BGW1_9ACTN|nr:crotonase/enoyl-CoA hydratase family protein [Marmoricola endophyticus]GGF40548.1 enoyl-CoA hydratase/isomerase family protein [Marmoricola endophyticus]